MSSNCNKNITVSNGYTESSFTVRDPEPTFNSDKIQWESYNRGMPEWVTIRDNNNQFPAKDQLGTRRTSVDQSASRITTNNSSQPAVKWTRIKAPGVIKDETIPSTFEPPTHDNVRSMNSSRTVLLAEPHLGNNQDINIERKSLIPSGVFSSTNTPRAYKPFPVKWTRIKASGNVPPNEKQESKEISKEKEQPSKKPTSTSRSRDNSKQQNNSKIKENISRKSSLIKSKSFIESPRQQHVQSVQKTHNLCQTKLLSIPVESNIQNLVAEEYLAVQSVKKSKNHSHTKPVSIPVESNIQNVVVNKQQNVKKSRHLSQTKPFSTSVESDIQNAVVNKQHDDQNVEKSQDLSQIKPISIPEESNIRNVVVNKQEDVQKSRNLSQTKLFSTPVESEIQNAVINKQHDNQSVQKSQDLSQIKTFSISVESDIQNVIVKKQLNVQSVQKYADLCPTKPFSTPVESDIQSVIVKKQLDVQSDQKYADLCPTKPFSSPVESDIQNVVVNKQHDVQSVQKSNDLYQTKPVSIPMEPDIKEMVVNKHPFVQGVKKPLELSQTKPFSISVEPDVQKAIVLNKSALKRRDSIERLKSELKDLLDSNLKQAVDDAIHEGIILETPIAKQVEEVQVDVSNDKEPQIVEATVTKIRDTIQELPTIIVGESKTERNENKKVEIAEKPLECRKATSAENLRSSRDRNVENTNLVIVKSVKSSENMAKTDEEKINVIKYMEQQKQRRLDKLKEDKIKKQMEAKIRKDRLKKLQTTTLAIVTKNVQNKKAKSASKTAEALPKTQEVNERHIITVPLTKPRAGTNKNSVKSRKIPMRSSIESLKRLEIKPSSRASRVSLAVTSKSSIIEIDKLETDKLNKSPSCQKFETSDLEKVEKPVSPSKGLTVKMRKHRHRKSVDLKIIEELKNTMQERIDKLSSVIENFSQNAVEVIRQTSAAGLNKTSQETIKMMEEPKPVRTRSPREMYIAACIIQSAIRGFLQRKKYLKLKQKYIQTCTKLQLKCESDDMSGKGSGAPTTPAWLKRGIVKPCPYNFIYAVKKKLNLAITGHVSYVDGTVNTINTLKIGTSAPELSKGDDQSKNSWKIHSKSEPKIKSPPVPFLTPLICKDYHTLKSPVESVKSVKSANENSGKASPYANDTFVKSTSSEDILNKAFIISDPKSSAKSKTSLHTEQASEPANNLSFKEQIISDLKALEELNKKLSTISNTGNTSLEFSSISSDIVKENNLDLTNNNNENKYKEISEKNISLSYSNTSLLEDINHKVTQTQTFSDKNKKSESSHISEDYDIKCDETLRKLRDDISDIEQLTKPTDMLKSSTSLEAPTKTYVKCDNLSKVDSKSNDLKEVLRYINDLKSSKTFIANKITQTSSKSDEKGEIVSRNYIEEETLFRTPKSEPEQNNLKQESAKSINFISNISNDFNTGPTTTTIKTDENIRNIAKNNQTTRKYNNNDTCYIPPLDLSKIRSLKTHRKSDDSTSMSSSESDADVQIKTSNINYERGDNIGRDVNILSFEQQVDRYSTEFEHSLTKSSSSIVSSVGYTKQTTYSEKYSTRSNTSSDDSRYSSLGKLDQLIREEHMRGMHLKTLLKNKEQALIDRTKGEIAMLEQKKRHLKEAGQMNEVSSIKKKQRGLLLNLQQERHEMDRLKKRQKKTYQERKNVLKEKQHNMKLHLANQNVIKTGRQDTSSRPKNVPFKGIDLGVVTKSRAENDALSLILSHREEELQKRRTHVETLIKWSQRLDEKEREVVEMENMLGIRNEGKSLAQLMEAPADLHTPVTDEQRVHRTTQMNNSTNLQDNKIEQKKEIETQTTEIAINPPVTENTRKARNEYKKVKGFDLNRLWKNMTGQKIKHFNDGDIILMTKDNLNKFYEDAKTEALKMFSTADDSVTSMFNQTLSDNGEPVPAGKSELESFCSHYRNKADNKIIEIVDDAKRETHVLSKLTITKAAIVNIFHSKSSSGSNTSLGIENVPLDNKVDTYDTYIPKLDFKNQSSSQESDADTVEIKQQTSELRTFNNRLSADSKISTEVSEDLNITASDIISTIDELTNVLKKNNSSLSDSSRMDENEIKKTMYRTNNVADIPETITLYKTMSSMKSSNSNSDGKLSSVNDTSSVSLDKDNYLEESIAKSSGSVQTMNQSPEQSVNESDILETAKSLLSDIQSVISEYRSGHLSSHNTNSEQSEDKSLIMNSENQDDDDDEIVISVKARYPGNAIRDPLQQSTTTVTDSNISVEDNELSHDNNITEEFDKESISDMKSDDNVKENSIPPVDIDNASARELSPREVKDLDIYSEIASSKESEEGVIQSSVEEEEESRGSSYESDLEKRLVSIDEGLKGITHKFEKIPMLESRAVSKLSQGTQDYLSDFESDFTPKESIKTFEHDESKIDDDYSVKDISEGLEQISEEVDDLNRNKDVSNKESPSTSVAEENFSEIESEISSKDKDDSDNQIAEIVKNSINEDTDVQNENFWCEDSPTKLSENLDINVHKLSEIIVPNSNLTEQQDVRQRVHQILSSSANTNRSPRVQDLWVTTNEALTPSPESSPPESPAESLQHFGSEAEELRRKQFEIEEEIKQIQQQSEHLEYCYVREIPNKPPPPYTPPGDSPPSQESPSTRTSLRNSITNLITKENVSRMVAENVEFMYDGYVDGKLENMEFKSVNEEDILNTAHEKFIFDLCKEIMVQHYTLVTARSNLPVWLKPKQIQQKQFLKTLEELTVFVCSEIMKLFNFENVKDVGRKRELSSKIHTREVKEEISDWKSLDQDYDLIAKNKATSDVMEMLLNETAKAVKAVLKKKYKK